MLNRMNKKRNLKLFFPSKKVIRNISSFFNSYLLSSLFHAVSKLPFSSQKVTPMECGASFYKDGILEIPRDSLNRQLSVRQ